MQNQGESALYGKGIFTTLAIYGHKPFVWEKHWRRLNANAAKIRIDLSEYSEETTRKALDELIAANSITEGRVRITFFDERPSRIWPSGGDGYIRMSILTGDMRLTPQEFKITISPYRVNTMSPLAGIKSCNYLDKLMALDEAKSRSFDEAIMVNERGEIASAVMANVFWAKDGGLFTPSLKTGCLAGTTREFVLENMECREIEAGIDDLQQADSIFLTSAGLGVVQVAEFESRKLETQDHPILDLLPKRP